MTSKILILTNQKGGDGHIELTDSEGLDKSSAHHNIHLKELPIKIVTFTKSIYINQSCYWQSLECEGICS